MIEGLFVCLFHFVGVNSNYIFRFTFMIGVYAVGNKDVVNVVKMSIDASQ